MMREPFSFEKEKPFAIGPGDTAMSPGPLLVPLPPRFIPHRGRFGSAPALSEKKTISKISFLF